MKNRLKNNQGFTLIELIMVIVILGILAIVAFPLFTDVVGDAETAALNGVVGGVRAGIVTVQAANLAGGAASPGFPPLLDGLPASDPCDSGASQCFDLVLQQGGVIESGWAKAGSTTTYTHTRAAGSSTWTYLPGAGTFLCTAGTCP